MINLRYHIVSLTAVFLAIGIGLTLGSTFLDRATVDNLNGQLESLESRLDDRETQIGELEASLEARRAAQDALDEQGAVLFADRLAGAPVLVLATAGVDEDDLDGATEALVAAGADLRGVLLVTDRFGLDDDAAIADLADVLGEESRDPARLRRTVVGELGGELRTRQLLGLDDGEAIDEAGQEPAAEPDPVSTDEPADPDAAAPDAPDASGSTVVAVEDEPIALVDALVGAGFLAFEPVSGSSDTPTVPAGTRLVIVGGSSDVPDDLVLQPLIDRMARATTTPVFGVVTSARPGDGEVGDAVAVIRQDDSLRELVPTVDSIEHFVGRAALVLALAEVADGRVGHYGLAEGASQLLPPPPGA